MEKSMVFENEPMRSRLFEVMFGEISDRINHIGEHKLADKYKPDIIAFTVDDVFKCDSFDELPRDWKLYVEACIEKYF